MAVTARAGAAASGVPADSPLTTKEGWAAFVRHEPAPPQPLPAAGPQIVPPVTRRGGSITLTCRW